MNWKHIITIYLKELKDSLRDRRTLISMIVIPTFLMPIIMFGIGTVMSKVIKQAQEEATSLVIIGGTDSPGIVTALKADMPKDLQNSDQADAIAEKIATTKGMDAVRPPAGAGPAGGPGGPPPGPPPSDNDDSSGTGVFGGNLTSSQSKTLDKLADLLGTDSTSLLQSLKSGTDLSDLVQQTGVDSSKVTSVLQDGLFVDTKA